MSMDRMARTTGVDWFRKLFDQSADAVWLYDPAAGVYVDCNRAAVVMMRCGSRAELLDHPLTELAPPTQPDGTPSAEKATAMRAATDAHGTSRFEWLARRLDGQELRVEIVATAVEIEGHAYHLTVVLDDTERRRRDQVQQATYQISEAVHTVEDLPDLYARIHEIIQDLMPAANFYIALYDATSELISFPYFVDERMAAPGLLKVGTGLTGHVLRSCRPLLVQRRMEPKKKRVGEAVLIEGITDLPYIEAGEPAAIWLGAPLSIRGRPIGVMAVQDYENENAYDEESKQILTFVAGQTALAIERKRAESDLRRALERERELSALKSSFVSMVSHEFRTPLGVILSSAEILETYFDRLEAEERREHLGSVQKNARRMAVLMEEVLLLGQVEAGGLEFKPQPMSLGRFCAQVAAEVGAASERRCPIECSVMGLPETVCLDEALLRHILTNVLSNGVKYSPAGRAVNFEVRGEGDAITFEIRDGGIGIPEADREWLFHAFHRGRNVGQRSGTGLGLVIVKRCVDLHGGSIRVESREGEGTTVTVQLPANCLPPQLDGAVGTVPRRGAPEDSLAP